MKRPSAASAPLSANNLIIYTTDSLISSFERVVRVAMPFLDSFFRGCVRHVLCVFPPRSLWAAPRCAVATFSVVVRGWMPSHNVPRRTCIKAFSHFRILVARAGTAGTIPRAPRRPARSGPVLRVCRDPSCVRPDPRSIPLVFVARPRASLAPIARTREHEVITSPNRRTSGVPRSGLRQQDAQGEDAVADAQR